MMALVRSLAHLLNFSSSFASRYLKKPETLKDWTASRLGHDSRYSLNCSKLKSLGWKQEKDFNIEIEKTIQWYMDNKNMFDKN